MKNWYICKIKYQKQTDDGRLKAVTEPYLVDAVSHTEAEARMHEIFGADIDGEFIIKGITPSNFTEIINNEDSDKYFKAKVTYISVDGDSSKEKKVSTYFLVSADTVKQAYERVEESLSSMLVPFEIPSVVSTPILDVFPFMDIDESLAEQARESREFHENRES